MTNVLRYKLESRLAESQSIIADVYNAAIDELNAIDRVSWGAQDPNVLEDKKRKLRAILLELSLSLNHVTRAKEEIATGFL
jgi:hypothetical protein